MGLLKSALIGFLSVVLLVLLANTVFNYMGVIYDYNETIEVNLSLRAPEVPTYEPHKFESIPVASARSGPGYSFYMESIKSDFYEYYGGIMKIWFENTGTSPLFIYEYGIKPTWVSDSDWKPSRTGIRINPGERKTLGLKNLVANVVEVDDGGSMSYTVQYGVSLMAKRSDGKWFDYGTVFTNPIKIVVHPAIEPTNKEYISNPRYLHNEMNRLVNSSDPQVIEISDNIAERYPGEYNVYQICALFDYVSETIEYVSDPVDEEIWQTPDETLELCAGDCEDYAILMASLISASGGNARLYLTDDHAFAAVYVGEDVKGVDDAIRRYYNTQATIYFMTDEYGSWLILDAVSGFYTGNLPVGATPSITDWDFENTSTITVVDVVDS
ncbi:MAG: transglutaminase family protein [Halobacteriota archaeon]|nr:transglutaminase family protein [Halobacteriota archaeon]